jgi:3-deoxy-D-manno-octulosonate 8-phosphate phosphatase (KDO 8-P phosphatase)
MTVLTEAELNRRAAELEWILCDVDGVLTDGGLFYGRRGRQWLRFNVRDGLGIKLAQQAGLKVGVFSGRESVALERRAAELKLDAVVMGSPDKGPPFESFLKRQNTVARRLAFVGDDLPDLIVLGQCGLSFAPADAIPEVRDVVHRVLEAQGGEGAVREMVEIILRARGVWDQTYSRFTFDS